MLVNTPAHRGARTPLPPTSCSGSGFRHPLDLDTNRDVRLLDTIAVALTTGNPGDVFAASFDKRQQVQLVLSKNGPPTPEDVSAANELISLIGSPSVADAIDLFPFLIRRCGVNIDKRIHNLHTSLQDGELLNDFMLALQAYTPEANIQAEFPAAGAHMFFQKYRNAVPAFATVWRDVVEMLTDKTAQGLDAEDVASSAKKYAKLFALANALRLSPFLKTLTDDRNLSNKDCKERAEKLKRRLGKVCQYVSGVSHLIQKAKRLFPIPHRWVTDTFTGTGEGVFDLCDSAYDAVANGLKQSSLSPETLNKLDRHFPSILGNWGKNQTVHACIHAELRIILHFGLSSLHNLNVHPIGVSKRSCFCCVLWMESHNRIFGTRWMTSGSHGKPYANWALPGAACSYAIGADGRSSVDDAVLELVSTRLTDALDWLFPGQKRISDEHALNGDESSDDGEEPSEWRQRLDELLADSF
ncbi:hypothetical protein D9615_008811 [Tricholomella constricta]|uniref:Uncharacterized protein n=1 Tax=Tricholomella constricta TaxID=117010 RepID=A0A8H5LYF0_9AGAR|nr:hypothetical protein D9615_008811 [Tricholomella constricta]